MGMLLKNIHMWLGILVLPWVIVIGLTGIYLNHDKAIYKMLPNGSYDEDQMDLWVVGAPVTEDKARDVANGIWPRLGITSVADDTYHGRPVYVFEKDKGSIIITKATGHYWVKSNFTRLTFDPDHRQLNRKYYWSNIFRTLHSTGWINDKLGSVLADIAAIAMVVFGITGLILFLIRQPDYGRTQAILGRHSKRSAGPKPQRIKLKNKS